MFLRCFLSSGSSWQCVETTASNKEALSCDEDFMCSSHGANDICLPRFPMFSHKEGGRHAFIHEFLEVLVLLSPANELNRVRHHVAQFLNIYLSLKAI